MITVGVSGIKGQRGEERQIRKGRLEGGLACAVKDWVGFQETEKEKDGGGGRLWRQHEPRHEAGGENVCVRLAMLSLREVTGNNVELGRVGSETWLEFGVDGVAHRLVSLGEKG